MGLELFTILVEIPGSKLQFDRLRDDTIVAMFNPNKLTLSRTVPWPDLQAAKRDNPEVQFTGAVPATLSVDLLFDTYDTPQPEEKKNSVRTYTDKLMHLTTVETHKGSHRPPVCRMRWGVDKKPDFFQGVLQQIDVNFTMFTKLGVPVRATAHCTFKQWLETSKDLQNQDLMSSDVAKVWVVKHGQSLATIASAEYGDPRAWRIIADANGIDNPLELAPGTRLLLPAQRIPWTLAMSP